MSIVTRTIQYTTQADGSLSVTEWHTDHLGEKYNRVYFMPVGTTPEQLEARALEYSAQLETELANAEIDQIIDEFE